MAYTSSPTTSASASARRSVGTLRRSNSSTATSLRLSEKTTRAPTRSPERRTAVTCCWPRTKCSLERKYPSGWMKKPLPVPERVSTVTTAGSEYSAALRCARVTGETKEINEKGVLQRGPARQEFETASRASKNSAASKLDTPPRYGTPARLWQPWRLLQPRDMPDGKQRRSGLFPRKPI